MAKRDFFFVCREDYEADLRNEVNIGHPLCSKELWNSTEVGNAVFIHPPAEFYEDYDPMDWRDTYEILRPSLEPMERKYIDSFIHSPQSKGGTARAKKMTAKQRSDSARKAAQARWRKAKSG